MKPTQRIKPKRKAAVYSKCSERNGEVAKLDLAMRKGVVMAVSEVSAEFHNDFGGQ